MISSAGWEDGFLEVTFGNTNTTYRYANVPEEIFNDMKKSASAGKYFTTFVKGKFLGVRVNSNTPPPQKKPTDDVINNNNEEVEF